MPSTSTSATTELPYRLGVLLGAGGFATVHAAVRVSDGVAAAVKIARTASPDARARFQREAEALTALGPPTVPRLYEAGLLGDGRPYLAMELIDWPTLASLLREGQRSPSWAAAMCDAILAGLACAHAAGIWHRDLKPSNLLVTEPLAVRMIDFGLAAMAAMPRLTRTGGAAGTVEYMAPEQLRGEDPGAPADIYSFGVIAYQLVTGQLPFAGDRAAVERGHLALRPTPPGRLGPLPDAVDRLVLACLAKEPAARPTDAAALRRALAAAFAEGAASRPERRVEPAPPPAVPSLIEPIAIVWISGEVSPFVLQDSLARRNGVLIGQRDGGWVCALVAGAGGDPVAEAEAVAERLLADGARAAVVTVADARVRRGRSLRVSGEAVERPRAWLPEPVPDGLSRAGPAAPSTATGEVVLVGAEPVLAAIASGQRQAFAGGGPVLFTLTGARGTGKSRLLRAAGELAGESGARVIVCGGRRAAGADTFAALVAALGHANVDVRGAIDALRGLARSGPVAVVIDDAHLADDRALDAISGVLSGAAARLWVGVGADQALTAARPAWGTRAPRHDQHHLDGLDPAAARQLAAALLAPATHVPAVVLDRLTEWSAGNPGVLIDLVDTLRREDVIRRVPGSDVWHVAADELAGVAPGAADDWAASRELARLPAELAHLARLAAALGPEVDSAELEAVVAALECGGITGLVDVGTGLAALIDRGLVIRTGRTCRFRRRGLALAIRRQLTAAERELLHRHALGYWRVRAGDPLRLHRIAHHAAEAGLAGEAVPACLELAVRAADDHRQIEAEEHYSRALALVDPADVATRIAALRDRGEVRRHLSHYEDALADLRAARELAQQRDDAVELTRLLVAEAAVCDFTERHTEAADLVERARVTAPPALPPVVAARMHNWLGVARHRQQRWDEAIALLQVAIELGRGCADHESVVGSELILAAALRNTGRIADGQAVLDGAIARCEERGDWFHLAIGLCNRINFWRLRRDPAAAVADLQRAMVIAAEMGFDEMEMYGRTELAALEQRLGNLERAIEHSTIAHRIAIARFRDQPVAVASSAHALLLAQSGRLGEAAAVVASLRGRTGADTPALAVTLRAVDLAVAGGSAQAWDDLLADARRVLDGEDAADIEALRARCR
jgi:tetratricopeptide (TPR) repeat protein